MTSTIRSAGNEIRILKQIGWTESNESLRYLEWTNTVARFQQFHADVKRKKIEQCKMIIIWAFRVIAITFSFHSNPTFSTTLSLKS